MLAIFTSLHCLCISISSPFTDEVTDIVFHIPRAWISRLEVHDAHLVDLSLKWYRDVHTELSRRLDRYVLQDDIGEVAFLPWHSMPGIEGRHQVPRMAGEGEETAAAAGILLGIVQYLTFFVLG